MCVGIKCVEYSTHTNIKEMYVVYLMIFCNHDGNITVLCGHARY